MIRNSAYATALVALIAAACADVAAQPALAQPAAAAAAGPAQEGASDAASVEPRSTVGSRSRSRAHAVRRLVRLKKPSLPRPPREKPTAPRRMGILIGASPALKSELASLSCKSEACLEFTLEAPFKGFPPRHDAPTAHRIGRALLPMNAWEVERQRRCLAHAAYAEARNQGAIGMLAVDWVIANRVAVSKTPTTPCDVIVQKGVLEAIWKPGYKTLRDAIAAGWMPADLVIAAPAKPGTHAALKSAEQAAMRRGVLTNVVDQRAYKEALLLAYKFVDGPLSNEDPTGGATFYWSPTAQDALDRSPPPWRDRCVKTAELGLHEFYRKASQTAALLAEVQ